MPKKKLMKPKLEKRLLESANQAFAMAKGEMQDHITTHKIEDNKLPATPNYPAN